MRSLYLFTGSHARPVEPDSDTIARCECVGVIFCPRHHVVAYARFEARHKAAVAA